MSTEETYDRGYVFRGPAPWAFERLIVTLAMTAFVAAVYFPVGNYTASRHYELGTELDEMIPFVADAIWMYFPGYLTLLLIATFAVREREVYYRTILSTGVASLICTAVFLVIPSTMKQPVVMPDGSMTLDLMRWMQRVDVPNNTFPSQHVAVAYTVAFGAWAFGRGWGVLLTLMATGVALATMLTKQHYWIDSPGGIAVAAFSHWIVFRPWRARTDSSHMAMAG